MRFEQLENTYHNAVAYRRVRTQHPTAPAVLVYGYIRSDGMLNFEQFRCETTRRHEWVVSEETDRCYCCWCGADGDA